MKDEFLMEVTRLIGDALVAPLIEIIVKFARPIYIFACSSTREFHFYDHMTRQIVDSQNNYSQNACKIVKAASTSKESLFLVDRDEYEKILICPVQYNVNKITQHNLLIISPAIITDTVSSTKDSFIATGDSFFARTTDRSWRRFDFTTQKWDSEEIPDKTKVWKVWKDTLNLASIGPRSFVGIECFFGTGPRYLVDDQRHHYRCFVYDGDSSESKEQKQKQKSVIIPLPDLVGEHSYYRHLLAFGIVKHDQSQQEMILAMFRLKLVYIITIKTRNPLTFDPPTILNLDTIHRLHLKGSFFIFEDQLWAILGSETSEQRNISYRFSFETMDWILSGTVPRELYSSTLQTIV
jgi:hypothetical protein